MADDFKAGSVGLWSGSRAVGLWSGNRVQGLWFGSRCGWSDGHVPWLGEADITCYACGKKGHYSNECWAKETKAVKPEKNEKKKCFRCHQPGHFIDKCPEKEGAIVKAYALEAIPSSSVQPSAKEKGKNLVIEGTLLISDLPVRVLFYTGAFRSYISCVGIEMLKWEPLVTKEPLRVSNPVGGPACLNMICCNVRITFCDVVLPYALCVLGFTGFWDICLAWIG